jgi:glycosyltransferase involved in cell wall biosynthesis
MNAKSIMYVTPAFPVGGAEKFLLSLANGLASAQGIRQTVISLSDNNKLQSGFDPSVQFLAMPRKGKFDVQPLKRMRQIIRDQHTDLIFCLNFFSFFVARVVCLGLKNKPSIVISYHSTIHVSGKEAWLHKLYFALLHKADRIITVSEKQAEYTARDQGVPLSRFITIHNGIDTAYWTPASDQADRARVRSTLGIPADVPVIALTAAFRIEKNHLGAIRALKLLRDIHGKKAHLLFVGDGPLRPQIEQAIQASGLQDQVHLAGIQQDVRPFYRASDLFSLCSTSVETFSIAGLEALSSGLPAVLTRIGGAEEMVRDGFNGFVCGTSDEEIAQGWKNALDGSFSAQAIHQDIEDRYSLAKMIEQYKSIL